MSTESTAAEAAPAKRPYHHGNLRSALIEAALALIEEKGPDGFTLREASRRAGVSSAAPYRHFADKTALLAAVAMDGIARIDTALLEAMKKMSDADPIEQFRVQGVTYVRFAVEHPSHFRAMYTPEVLDAERFPELAEMAQRSHSLVLRSIAQGQKDGDVYDGDPAAIALTAISLVYGVSRLFVDGMLPAATDGGGAELAEQLALAVTDVLGHGLLPRDEDTAKTAKK